MGVSTRRAVAAHALTFLARLAGRRPAALGEGHREPAEQPALVRRVLGMLQIKDLVGASEGSGGGWRLARPAEQITIFDAYGTVEKRTTVLPTHAHPPNQSCAIGRHMRARLEDEFTAAQGAMERRPPETSIADMLRRIHR